MKTKIAIIKKRLVRRGIEQTNEVISEQYLSMVEDSENPTDEELNAVTDYFVNQSGKLSKVDSAIITTGKGLGLTLSVDSVKQISQTLPTDKPTKLQITQKILSFLEFQEQADSEALEFCENQVKQKLTEYFVTEDENTEKLMSTVTACYQEGNEMIRKKNQSIMDILDEKIAIVQEQRKDFQEQNRGQIND